MITINSWFDVNMISWEGGEQIHDVPSAFEEKIHKRVGLRIRDWRKIKKIF